MIAGQLGQPQCPASHTPMKKKKQYVFLQMRRREKAAEAQEAYNGKDEVIHDYPARVEQHLVHR